MEALTDDELALVRRGVPVKRRSRLSMACLIVGCIGSLLVVAPDAYDLAQADVTVPDFQKTIGFVAVLLAFLLCQWGRGRYELIAQSALVKLYRNSYCLTCACPLPQRPLAQQTQKA